MPGSMKVMVIGGGGREHALAWGLARSESVETVYVVPGNGGTVGPKLVNVTDLKTYDAMAQFAAKNEVALVVPGPELPLVEGVATVFKKGKFFIGIPVFGPSPNAARIEGSKAFSKSFMARHHIPTARFATFTSHADALAYLRAHYTGASDVVIKASGLAAGKGVLLPETMDEAVAGLASIMVGHEFGDAGAEVVIEERLEGEEVSVLAITDGYSVVALPGAQDHKRVFEGDAGPNTGGMGAYAPAPVYTEALQKTVMETVLRPTVDGMRRDGTPFVGCLYAGLMLTKEGVKVLEYNCRFGDPETQVVVPLLDGDLAEVLLAAAEGRLDSVKVGVKKAFAATVVVASEGYPGSYPKGVPMTIGDVPEGVTVFHAGTAIKDGQLVTAGGRVVAVTAVADTLESALALANANVSKVSFAGAHHRRDIGHRALALLRSKAPASGLTYADAGVSIDAGNALVERIKASVRATRRPGADAEIGGFGGVFDLAGSGYAGSDTVLVAGTDGVGTKLKLAHTTGTHGTIGIDLVAMSVNDVLVQGAEPLLFLDYFACSRLEVGVAAEVVAGIAEGCLRSKCALVGGETAEMPGMYADGEYDLAGFVVGAVKRSKLLPRLEEIKEGDAVLGLRSSGPHSNGYSLIRKVVERAGLQFGDRCPWEETGRTVGAALLEPTKIYVKELLPVLQGGDEVKALCHVTGGGFLDNVPRCLPKGFGAEIDASAWALPPVFGWLKKAGGIADAELARTFNMGIGMVIVVAQEHVEKVTEAIVKEGGDRAVRLGKVIRVDGSEAERVKMLNMEAAWKVILAFCSATPKVIQTAFSNADADADDGRRTRRSNDHDRVLEPQRPLVSAGFKMDCLSALVPPTSTSPPSSSSSKDQQRPRSLSLSLPSAAVESPDTDAYPAATSSVIGTSQRRHTVSSSSSSLHGSLLRAVAVDHPHHHHPNRSDVLNYTRNHRRRQTLIQHRSHFNASSFVDSTTAAATPRDSVVTIVVSDSIPPPPSDCKTMSPPSSTEIEETTSPIAPSSVTAAAAGTMDDSPTSAATTAVLLKAAAAKRLSAQSLGDVPATAGTNGLAQTQQQQQQPSPSQRTWGLWGRRSMSTFSNSPLNTPRAVSLSDSDASSSPSAAVFANTSRASPTTANFDEPTAIGDDDASSEFILARIEQQNGGGGSPGRGEPLQERKSMSTFGAITSQLRLGFASVRDSVTGSAAAVSASKDEDHDPSEDIDWDFWGKVMNNYEEIARKQSRLLTKKLQQGIPDAIRGMVWQLMSRSKDPELEATYRALLTRASPHEKVIQRDLARTFPKHEHFANPGPGSGQEGLFNVLRAYSMYDTEVGYCQGIAFITGPLLLNMPDEEAFSTLVKLMHSYALRELFTPSMTGLHLRLHQFDRLLDEHLPAIAKHLKSQDIRSTMYASQWFMTLFAYRFPLDMVFRIMDIVFAEGFEAVFRFALALLRRNQDAILSLEFEQLLEFLKVGLFDIYIGNVGALISAAAGVHISKRWLDRVANEHAEEARRANPDLAMTADQMKAENRRLLDQLRKLEGAYEALNKEHTELAKMHLEARERVERAETRAEELRVQVEGLKRVLTEERLGAEAAVREEMDRLARKNLELTGRNVELEERVEGLEEEVRAERRKVEESEKRRGEMERRWEGLRAALR
ncbi:hypothetical protein HDU96_003781 [Phlyctochytrium bullatum]|nr:hypothetical protein HDU96_003781 [Phlyctochytrium bullatum]